MKLILLLMLLIASPNAYILIKNVRSYHHRDVIHTVLYLRMEYPFGINKIRAEHLFAHEVRTSHGAYRGGKVCD